MFLAEKLAGKRADKPFQAVGVLYAAASQVYFR